jgi:AraC-like DNA-binding protein
MAILIDTSDDRLLKMLAAHCEAVLKGRGTRRARLLQTVEQRIVDLLPKGTARATVIATELGVSQRTLPRQLAALGTSFHEVLDQIRKQLALKYVSETGLGLAQFAFLLGSTSQRLLWRSGDGQAKRPANCDNLSGIGGSARISPATVSISPTASDRAAMLFACARNGGRSRCWEHLHERNHQVRYEGIWVTTA